MPLFLCSWRMVFNRGGIERSMRNKFIDAHLKWQWLWDCGRWGDVVFKSKNRPHDQPSHKRTENHRPVIANNIKNTFFTSPNNFL